MVSIASGVARGGAARPATDLWWISYFFHFVWSSPSSFGLKTHRFFRKDLFFCWSSDTFGPKTHLFCNEDLFFGLHLFLVQKRVPPRNPAPGATIFSNASEQYSIWGTNFTVFSIIKMLSIIIKVRSFVWTWHAASNYYQRRAFFWALFASLLSGWATTTSRLLGLNGI